MFGFERKTLKQIIKDNNNSNGNKTQLLLIIAKMFLIKCKCQINDYKKNTFH